jgi:hypothetical protein
VADLVIQVADHHPFQIWVHRIRQRRQGYLFAVRPCPITLTYNPYTKLLRERPGQPFKLALEWV